MSQKDTQKKRKVKPEDRPVIAENGVSDYSWGSLPLAIQLILPLAIITLIIGRRGIGIRPYPVLDTYVSLICPSFKQRQRLLKWMSDRIPHMPNKIAEYWKDGSLLCTLINTAVPGACPNPQRHWHQPPSHGQALAFKYLGVTPMLNEENFKEKTFNYHIEKSFVKYLLAVQDAIAKLDARETTELKYTSKYIPRGMGLFTGEKNRTSVFYIYPNSRLKKMQNVLINVKGPYSTYGTQTISAQHIFRTLASVKKVQKDVRREQKKLTIPSKAQRSFFRSLSIDLAPLANIISNRRSNDEIPIKVEIEEGRAKVSFIPPHTGIYELCLTTDGEHLTGSPFNISITKNETNVVDSFEPNNKKGQLKKTGKIISKCFTFINESVRITNNNNNDYFNGATQNKNSNLTVMTSTKILCKLNEDGNSYEQDSGVFDTNESLSEITDDTQQNEENSLNEIARKNCETAMKKATAVIKGTPKYESDLLKILKEEASTKVVKRERDSAVGKVNASAMSPEEALQVISDMIDLPSERNDEIKISFQNNTRKETTPVEERRRKITDSECHVNIKQSVKEKLENNTSDLLNLKSNSEFEDLYNKYIKNEENSEESPSSHLNPEVTRETDNFAINTELRLLKKVSNVRAVKQKFENDSPSVLANPDLITCHSQRNPKRFQIASPVSQGIEQEVEPSRSPKDATHPSQDGASSLVEENNRLTYVENEINVIQIRAKFESNISEVKSTLRKNNCNVDLLKETKKHLAVSLPNLIVNDLSKQPMNSTGSNSLESITSEDENMSQKFQERYQFWNNLVQQNSSVSGLNLATSDFGSSDSFIRTKANNLKTLSRSTYSLEQKTENAEEVKPELKKQLSADEMTFPSVKDRRNYYLSNVNQNGNPQQRNATVKEELVTSVKKEPIKEIKTNPHEYKRNHLIYDRVRVLEVKDSKKKEVITTKYQKTILQNRAQSDEGLTTKVTPESNEPNQQEDVDFADIMRQRFEKSRQYFKSLETLPTKRKSYLRRSSLDTSVRKVSDRFSLNNLYRDVISEKIKRSSFKGSPNRCAVAETLASISSRASSLEEESAEDNDLDLKYFQMKKKTRERKSIRSLFNINY